MQRKNHILNTMKNFRLFLTASIVFGFFVQVAAQKKELTGHVVDEASGSPLEGVNIIIEKSKTGTTTQKDGSFSISLKSAKSTLVFSNVGYATQIVKVEKDMDTLRVLMKQSYTENAEVVVIGYGTQRRSEVTGAISKFKNDKLDESPVSRLDQALQGKIAGLQVQNVTSEAGADPKINIRG